VDLRGGREPPLPVYNVRTPITRIGEIGEAQLALIWSDSRPSAGGYLLWSGSVSAARRVDSGLCCAVSTWGLGVGVTVTYDHWPPFIRDLSRGRSQLFSSAGNNARQYVGVGEEIFCRRVGAACGCAAERGRAIIGCMCDVTAVTTACRVSDGGWLHHHVPFHVMVSNRKQSLQ